MKKRILSFALVLCLLMQTLCVITSAVDLSPTPVYSQTELDAKDFLVRLGALDENVDLNGVATKSSFLCMVLKATKTTIVDAEKQYFTDVPATYYAANEIATGYNAGYIRGNGNGTFSPDKIINSNEALAIAMNALNYGYMAGSAEYYNVIKNQNILKNVEINADGTLDNGACVVLLKNMLMAEYNMLSGVVGDSGIYTRDGETTLLYLCYSIIQTTGQITAVGNTYVEGYLSTVNGYIRINDVLVEDEEGIANDLLGFRVKAFVEKNENGYKLFAAEKTKQNKELVIDAEYILADSTATKVVYKDENKKEKTIKLPIDYTLIYNGKNYNGFDNSVFHINQGKIRLVSSNGNEYSLVYVYEYENKIIKKINPSDQLVYLEGEDTPIDLKKKDKVILQNASGKSITCEELYEGLVLTIFATKGSSVVSTIKAGKGEFVMVPDSIDDEFIFMGDEHIRMTNALKSVSGTITLGKKTIFMLDAFGDAVSFETVSTNEMYGYLVAFEETYSRPQNVLYDVKIFTENDRMEIFSTEKELRVDGRKYDSTTALNKFKSSNVIVPQFVKFTVTEDNALKEIWRYTDRSAEVGYIGYDEDNFTLDYDLTDKTFQYRDGNYSFNTKVIANSSTLHFMIPASGEDKDYRCKSWTGISNNITSGKDYKFFDIGKNRVATIILEENAGASSSFNNAEYQTPVVISKVSRVADEEGFTYLSIKGFQGKEEVRFTVEEESLDTNMGDWVEAFADVEANELEAGDIVQINASEDGKVQSMRILYRRSAPNTYDEMGTQTPDDNDYYGWMYTTSAKILEQYTDVVIAHTNRNATLEGAAARNRVMPFASSTQFYVYDSLDNKVRKTDQTEYMEGYNAFFAISLSKVAMVVIYK